MVKVAAKPARVLVKSAEVGAAGGGNGGRYLVMTADIQLRLEKLNLEGLLAQPCKRVVFGSEFGLPD